MGRLVDSIFQEIGKTNRTPNIARMSAITTLYCEDLVIKSMLG